MAEKVDLEDIDVISDGVGEALNTVESVLGENDVEDLNECATKSKRKTITPGIVYLSRIPPFMKPVKIRQLLSEYGEVGRVFLQPEDSVVRLRRKKFGGNKKRNYTEGWVEFADKRVAKGVALTLNNSTIGGKKRNYYHDDLWNIKYLPKFRWTHLTEKVAYDNAVRSQKVRTEVSQAKRENEFFLQNVEKGKAITSMRERKRKKALEKGMSSSGWEPSVKRVYKQRVVKDGEELQAVQTSGVVSTDLLKKIFTGSRSDDVL